MNIHIHTHICEKTIFAPHKNTVSVQCSSPQTYTPFIHISPNKIKLRRVKVKAR